MDLWPQREFDFDKVFRATTNPEGVDPDIAKVRKELNDFKTELKPWLQEVGDSRRRRLEMLGEFLHSFVILDMNGRLAVSELNPVVCKYIYEKTGLVTETTSIKRYMETLYEKPKNDTNFWYKGNGGCFYKGIRWRTPEEKAKVPL